VCTAIYTFGNTIPATTLTINGLVPSQALATNGAHVYAAITGGTGLFKGAAGQFIGTIVDAATGQSRFNVYLTSGYYGIESF